ncbi:MAG: putative toxin-antitoxin system toxin component, PIN family [Steroidobacteraceae bacterium]
MRVALDTNVLVSAVATRGLCADVLNLVLAEHELIVGETVLAELKRVLRERIRVPVHVVAEVDNLLRQEATVIPKVEPLRMRIRDKSDLAVLSEAVAGRAEVLVTGDKDLLELPIAAPVQVMTPRTFWEQLRRAPRGR